MKHYSIAPNKDATAWFVKVEDIGLEEQYSKKDAAIEAGEKMASENKPSTLSILNKYHEVDEEKTFE
ncbi:MAG TPA: DUF2188 domain-containing protein [Pseudogracilibacillus sp.]|nr:DUF2188 domain-containing protein [Pseudogracilibacillus sp.]